MALSSKLVVVVELSQRDRQLLSRIADAVAPRTEPDDGETPVSFAREAWS